MTDEEIPEYLRKLPPLRDDEIWASIEVQFHEFCDLLSTLKVETKEQAVFQRHGITKVDKGIYWEDPNAKRPRRSWLQIPFDPARDEEHFYEIWQTAKHLAELLKPKIRDRRIDVQFLSEWGAFCRYAGVIQSEHLRDRPNLQHLKGGVSQNKDQHKRWYAHVFVRLRRNGDDRKATDMRVIEHLYDMLEKNEFPDPDFPGEWYQEFFGKNTDDLTRAFQEGTFKTSEIEDLAKSTLDDLPSFGLSGSDP